MFQLTKEEHDFLRSQIATIETGRGKHRKYLPYAFTEYGALMAANVLNSEIAVQANIRIIKAFVKLREIASSRKEIINKISEIESRVDFHDETLVELIEAVRKLLPMANTQDKKKIGFTSIS